MKKYDYYVGMGYGNVSVLDKTSKETKIVSKEEYYNNKDKYINASFICKTYYDLKEHKLVKLSIDELINFNENRFIIYLKKYNYVRCFENFKLIKKKLSDYDITKNKLPLYYSVVFNKEKMKYEYIKKDKYTDLKNTTKNKISIFFIYDSNDKLVDKCFGYSELHKNYFINIEKYTKDNRYKKSRYSNNFHKEFENYYCECYEVTKKENILKRIK